MRAERLTTRVLRAMGTAMAMSFLLGRDTPLVRDGLAAVNPADIERPRHGAEGNAKDGGGSRKAQHKKLGLLGGGKGIAQQLAGSLVAAQHPPGDPIGQHNAQHQPHQRLHHLGDGCGQHIGKALVVAPVDGRKTAEDNGWGDGRHRKESRRVAHQPHKVGGCCQHKQGAQHTGGDKDAPGSPQHRLHPCRATMGGLLGHHAGDRNAQPRHRQAVDGGKQIVGGDKVGHAHPAQNVGQRYFKERANELDGDGGRCEDGGPLQKALAPGAVVHGQSPFPLIILRLRGQKNSKKGEHGLMSALAYKSILGPGVQGVPEGRPLLHHLNQPRRLGFL